MPRCRMRVIFAALVLLVAGADLAAGAAQPPLDYAALAAGVLLFATAIIDRVRPSAPALPWNSAP